MDKKTKRRVGALRRLIQRRNSEGYRLKLVSNATRPAWTRDPEIQRVSQEIATLRQRIPETILIAERLHQVFD